MAENKLHHSILYIGWYIPNCRNRERNVFHQICVNWLGIIVIRTFSNRLSCCGHLLDHRFTLFAQKNRIHLWAAVKHLQKLWAQIVLSKVTNQLVYELRPNEKSKSNRKWKFTKYVWDFLQKISLKMSFNDFRNLYSLQIIILSIDKGDDSFEILARVNSKCDWLCEFYMKFYVGGFFVSNLLMSTASILICWMKNGHFDTNSVYHILKMTWVEFSLQIMNKWDPIPRDILLRICGSDSFRPKKCGESHYMFCKNLLKNLLLEKLNSKKGMFWVF